MCIRSGGLLQREIERAGIPTVSLSNVPEMTEKVAVSRCAFIQYPFGRQLGQVGDRAGQRAVCDDMVDMLVSATGPNTYRHLPYEWPEPAEEAKWRPDIPAPMGLKRIKDEEEGRKKAVAASK
jgi:D-proline reductase (dithiol) PrdB